MKDKPTIHALEAILDDSNESATINPDGSVSVYPIKGSENYPEPWIHAMIHLNPETGEIHSDGDHAVRDWILERITS